MPQRLRAILGRDARHPGRDRRAQRADCAADRRQSAAGDCEGDPRCRRGNDPRRGRHGRGRKRRDAVQRRAHRDRHCDLDGRNARVAR